MTRKTGKNVGEKTLKFKGQNNIITQLLFMEYLLGSMQAHFDFGLRKVLCEV